MLGMSDVYEKNPNPQGKGLVPMLSHWQASRPRGVSAKTAQAVLLDLFTSTLVLSAEFHFRPVVGQRYFLYWRADGWRLSLIGPQEGGQRAAGVCLGECELREDMTWQLNAEASLAESASLRDAVAVLLEAFLLDLDTDEPLTERLPGYRADLPYYRRLFASGLSASLRESLRQSRSAGMASRDFLLAEGRGLQQGLQRIGATE